jgi:hypothetical protein
MEADILEAATAEKPLLAPKLAARAGYECDRAYRRTLALLRRRGLLTGQRDCIEYLTTPRGLEVLRECRQTQRQAGGPQLHSPAAQAV